jgi:hypothetical protein
MTRIFSCSKKGAHPSRHFIVIKRILGHKFVEIWVLKMPLNSPRYFLGGSIYRCCKCLEINNVSGRMFDEGRTGNNSKNSYSRL